MEGKKDSSRSARCQGVEQHASSSADNPDNEYPVTIVEDEEKWQCKWKVEVATDEEEVVEGWKVTRFVVNRRSVYPEDT